MNDREAPDRTMKRLLYHHVPLCIISAVLLWLFYVLFPSPDETFRWSISTAYVALFLLAFTLLTGPFNVLAGRPNPLSTDLRRDAGIWAGLIGLVHVAFGANVHFASKIWPYFFAKTENTLAVRTALFGFANHTGLVATLIIIVLLLTSNDFSMRLLGSRRWKLMQYTNHALFVLVLFHGFAYQTIEKRKLLFVLLLTVLTLFVLAAQVAGLSRRMRGPATEHQGH